MQKLIKKAADRQYGGPLLLLLLRIRISPALGFGHALETHRTSFEFVNMVSPKLVREKSSDQGSFFFARLRGRTTKKGPRRNLFAASLGRRTSKKIFENWPEDVPKIFQKCPKRCWKFTPKIHQRCPKDVSNECMNE